MSAGSKERSVVGLVADVAKMKDPRAVMYLENPHFRTSDSVGYSVRSHNEFADSGSLVLWDNSSGQREICKPLRRRDDTSCDPQGNQRIVGGDILMDGPKVVSCAFRPSYLAHDLIISTISSCGTMRPDRSSSRPSSIPCR